MQPQSVSSSKDDLIEPSEKILIVVRKHWVGLAGVYLVAAAALGAITTLSFFLAPSYGFNGSFDDLSVAGAGGTGLLIILVLFVLVISYIYRQSHLVLTDKSLVQMTQTTLFNKKVTRLSMSNVEDVKAEQRGVLATIFNFGTLTIQTAGEQDNFIFPLCPSPNRYAERILEARQAYADLHRGLTA